jgi:hypothetical protein
MNLGTKGALFDDVDVKSEKAEKVEKVHLEFE